MRVPQPSQMGLRIMSSSWLPRVNLSFHTAMNLLTHHSSKNTYHLGLTSKAKLFDMFLYTFLKFNVNLKNEIPKISRCRITNGPDDLSINQKVFNNTSN